MRKIRKMKVGWGYGGGRKHFFGRVSDGASLRRYLRRDLTKGKEVLRNEKSWDVRVGVVLGRRKSKCNGLNDNSFGFFKANQEMQKALARIKELRGHE